jgi:hypothetical protein
LLVPKVNLVSLIKELLYILATSEGFIGCHFEFELNEYSDPAFAKCVVLVATSINTNGQLLTETMLYASDLIGVNEIVGSFICLCL